MEFLDIARWLSLVIYMIVFWKSFDCLKYINRCHKVRRLKETITCFLILIIAQTVMFMYLQCSWIFSGSEHLDTPNSVLWLIFDLFNGFALLAYVVSLDLYLKWRCWTEPCEHFRRRIDDP